MPKDRGAWPHLLPALVSLTIVAAIGLWLALRSNEGSTPAAATGVVTVNPQTVHPSAPPRSANPTPAQAALPAAPDTVIAQVRRAYPLLTHVDFSCDAAGGCAVTATIPPPTDEAFLAKRQEMLLGGLAKTIAASGYTPQGPVQMDEVAFNTFRIRASVAQAGASPP